MVKRGVSASRNESVLPIILARSGLFPTALTLPRFRALLAHPTWLYLAQAVIAGRLYREGFEASLEMLAFMEDNRKALSGRETKQALLSIGALILATLDKTDRWEEFLDWHGRIERETGYGLKRGRCRVIQRKIARVAEGKARIGDYHHSPDSISEDERRTRLNQIFAWAEAGILRTMKEQWPRCQ